MGVFDKIVNFFSDDVEEETPKPKKEKKEKVVEEIKKEVPIKEEKASNKFTLDEEFGKTKEQSERGLYQSKDTFKFPVFDDNELETTLSRSRNNNGSVLDRETPRETPKRAEVIPSRISAEVKKETPAPEPAEKKMFRPSPVISPIYGILDKNYTKDEIVEKSEVQERKKSDKELTYDAVRRKAYGTLEDELEDTLMSINRSNKREVEEIGKELDSLEDPKKHIEKLLDELEKTASMTVGEIEEALKEKLDDTVEVEFDVDDISEFDDEINNKPKRNIEDMLDETEEFKPKDLKKEEHTDEELENDLFNLIDSMYDEGDEK